ncbi:unnamed protein product, partial [marine sediment metagenome]
CLPFQAIVSKRRMHSSSVKYSGYISWNPGAFIEDTGFALSSSVSTS